MQLSPTVKNIIPGLTERGKIKIGRKGSAKTSQNGNSFQLPEKLDHFVVTTLERGADGNFVRDSAIHKVIGEKPKRIPICVLYDGIAPNFISRYASYQGKTLWCHGDGENALRLDAESKGRQEVSCPCYRQEPTYTGKDKCKINGTLSCIIDGADCVGGVWKFRTTGYNSTVGILSSLTLLRSLTGGILAGMPLVLTVQPKVATNPIAGKSQTVYVVGVEYNGNISDLQKSALQIASGNAEFRNRLAHVETEAQLLISADSELIDQAGDINEEFYPDAPVITDPEDEPEEQPQPEADEPVISEPEPVQEPEPVRGEAIEPDQDFNLFA